MTHALSSTDISILSPEISIFYYFLLYRYRLHFNTQFLILFTLFESLKVVLIVMVTILMISGKLATLGPLKIKKIFWNKGYDVIISVNNATNKILSLDSNYIVNVVMWLKLLVTLDSLWEKLSQPHFYKHLTKKAIFSGVLLVWVQ